MGKRKLIRDVDNIASYAMSHNSANVLGGGSPSTSVVKRVRLIGEEAKGNARWYLKVIEEDVDLAFYTRVVVEGITVEIAELRGVPF